MGIFEVANCDLKNPFLSVTLLPKKTINNAIKI